MGAAGNSLKYKSIHFTELKEITMTSLMVSMTPFIAGIKDRFSREERGATMVEYGIMVALIAVVVIVAIGPLGIAIRDMFAGVTAGI